MIKLIIGKKSILVVFLLLVFVSLIVYIGFSLYNRINITKDLYNDVSDTFETVFNSFNKSLSEFKKTKSSSYTVNINFKNISSLPFSSLTLSNNFSDKYYELSFNNLNIKGKRNLDINAFVTKDKIGFYFDKNPEFYYTANGKMFRLQWNTSIFGKFARIPDFVPETIDYNKLNSIMLPKNIVKVFLGMGLGREKINIKDIIKNISISSPNPYVIYQNGKQQNAQIAHLTVSKEYLESFVTKLKNSSENASFDYLNTFLKGVQSILKESPQKSLKIDFVILNNRLLWAETSAGVSKGLVNIKLNLNSHEMSLAINQLMPHKSPKVNYILKLSAKSPSHINLQLAQGKKEIFSFNIHKNIDSTVTSQICYYNKKSKPQFIVADYSPKSQKFKSNIPTKNIYSLSLSDLFKLYSKIDSTHKFALKSFSFS